MTVSVDMLKNEVGYQIVVRGTQAEVLAANPTSERSGDVLPIGICTDTGAILTWASGRWMPSTPLSFGNTAALDAAVAANGGQSLGPSVSVAGVLKTWDGGGYSPRIAADITALRTQTNPTTYVETDLPRILGSGRFKVAFVPSLNDWMVVPGQVPVRLDGPVNLTAVSTAYAQLVNAVVGPLFRNYETWQIRATARSGGVYTATASLAVRTSGSTANVGNAAGINGASNRARRAAVIRRSGTDVQRVAGQSDNWSATPTSDLAAVDFSTFSIEAGITPGASGDTYVLEEFTFSREA